MIPAVVVTSVVALALLVAAIRALRAAGDEDRLFEEARQALAASLVTAWDTRIIRPHALRLFVGDSHVLEDLALRAPPWIVKAAAEWQPLSPIGVRALIASGTAGETAFVVARTRAGGVRAKLVAKRGERLIEEALAPADAAPPRDLKERFAALVRELETT